ncbi:hypothetical protein BJX99DRAFT_254725 [Aspergillus californicus]
MTSNEAPTERDHPPQGDEKAFCAWVSAREINSMPEEIRRDGIEDFRSTIYNKMWFLSLKYSMGSYLADHEPTLHALWYTLFQAGMNVTHTAPEQDRWILDLLRIQGQGYLRRPAPRPRPRPANWLSIQDNERGGKRAGSDDDGDEEYEMAQTTGGGVLWADLPFFVEDMRRLWLAEWEAMERDHRTNLAGFLAKLAATGLDNDRLSSILLHVLQEMLETDRPLVRQKEVLEPQPLSVEDLIPTANVIMRYAGIKLLTLSDQSWNGSDENLGVSELEGFSPQRYLLWVKRLDAIEQEARRLGYAELEKAACGVLDRMLVDIEGRYTRILRAWETAGGLDSIVHKPVINWT